MTDRSADEALIRQLFDRTTDAWTRNDADAYAAEFAEDSDYVVFDGTRLRGRTAIRDLHAQLFDTLLYGTRLEGGIESIRFLTDDIALVHATGAVIFAWQQGTPKRRLSRNTWVLQRFGSDWKAVAFHNNRVRPVPTNSGFVRTLGRFVQWRTRRAAVHRPHPRPSRPVLVGP
ncbi:SgcJ/EcaC family oxidoreductase [Nocardia huaxiensis]|uniref:SgcJ/EcaC family oxidoreductase n=1 Tax=Nocardia huaxiensis TaxID=2755382 RepID=A0A7D6Z7N9_9NOCA|nr:SgcJ/EcaC family oxidoreductase [Nocardia huaxiensis]QLY28988.1 SgcJ/EcaC family oxidoreductase [Nocardia huaxiensis]UFS97531.1 SgcJ/EcaC family oxidoreductase [Nocardia huaxiensis]